MWQLVQFNRLMVSELKELRAHVDEGSPRVVSVRRLVNQLKKQRLAALPLTRIDQDSGPPVDNLRFELQLMPLLEVQLLLYLGVDVQGFSEPPLAAK